MTILSTVGAAVVTSFATTVVLQVLLSPRLEARNRRIQEAHRGRERLSACLLKIDSACARLQAVQAPQDGTPTVQARLQAERQRWITQIDDETAYLVDNMEWSLGTYAGVCGGPRDFISLVAWRARGVWLSEREVDSKIEIIQQLAQPLRHMLFSYWWIILRHSRKDQRTLRHLLAQGSDDSEGGRVTSADSPAQ